MSAARQAKWLDYLERRMQWLAVPNIAILLITCQVAGFFFVSSDPTWVQRLALIPGAVLQNGEWYRLLTFLALPLTTSPIWVIFGMMFLYFILNSIEQVWGAFKTTLYVLVSVLLMIAFSFAFDYPITQIGHFESTLFLAAASLFPDMEIRLFFVVPAKLKWMAWLTGVFALLALIQGTWIDRLFLVVVYSNFLLFFGPALLSWIQNWVRRKRYQRRSRL